MQAIARHAYALTYEKEYVEQWEEQQQHGEWGGSVDWDEEGNVIREPLRQRYVQSAWTQILEADDIDL